VNTIFRLITLCPGPSTTTVSANSLYSCNGSPSLRHLHTARALRDRLHAKLAELLDAGRYILGPEVAGFEAELAEYLVVHLLRVGRGRARRFRQ
jgi:hypothetical protein